MTRPIARLQLVQIAFALVGLALLGRAAQVQLLQGARHAATAEAQRTERRTYPARRGTIHDRKGTALALTQEAFRVDVTRTELADPEADARRIAKHLGLSLRATRRELRRQYGYFGGPFTSLQVQPLRGMRGVYLTRELNRFQPHPDLARTIIGRPGGDGRPASGIERVLDSVLTGLPGTSVVLKDRHRMEYESPARLGAFPVPGHDVYLTLDADLQEIVEQALADAIAVHDAEGGDVVALDPATGEVLALASQGSSSTGAWTGAFEPGSTAKLFAAAALLTERVARPGDTVWAERGTFHLNGRVITDEHPEGWLTLRDVIRRSSNIGIVKFSLSLSHEEQYQMLRRFGLGSPTGLELPAETAGTLRRPRQWSGTSAASVAMGYEIAVSALQLAQAYAAIANDGLLMQPTVVREVRSPNGKTVYRHVPQPVRRVVPSDVAAELRGMLRGVVYEGGTGATAALTSYEVAGKTGTALRAGRGGYVTGSYTATFASMFPAEDPQLVMVVKLDDPREGYATLTAAPVTRRVLQELLAARAGVLDRTRLTRSSVSGNPESPANSDPEPWVSAWPVVGTADSATARVVPNVTGLPLRQAAHQLHQAGLRVRALGWGEVLRSEPAAGVRVARGTLVTITAPGSGR
ncbi:MAG: penicillin-binding transpeptidase domain-containing protein [Gemmatimonadota bacterium]|nr:penicillin-binding transpeptidase domain-containing protein [Gemmatimonadota bacterium]